MGRGVTLVELLVVTGIISILVSLSIFIYVTYSVYAARLQVISDIRNCLQLIAVSKQVEDVYDTAQIVSECPKSTYTKSITLTSESPIVLRAEADTFIGNITCSYDESIGYVECSSPF